MFRQKLWNQAITQCKSKKAWKDKKLHLVRSLQKNKGTGRVINTWQSLVRWYRSGPLAKREAVTVPVVCLHPRGNSCSLGTIAQCISTWLRKHAAYCQIHTVVSFSWRGDDKAACRRNTLVPGTLERGSPPPSQWSGTAAGRSVIDEAAIGFTSPSNDLSSRDGDNDGWERACVKTGGRKKSGSTGFEYWVLGCALLLFDETARPFRFSWDLHNRTGHHKKRVFISADRSLIKIQSRCLLEQATTSLLQKFYAKDKILTRFWRTFLDRRKCRAPNISHQFYSRRRTLLFY